MANQNEQVSETGAAAETRRNQAGQNLKDDPRHAAESGDPDVAGHVQGHVSPDDADGADDSDRPQRRPGDGEQDWESGRQAAL